MAYHAYDEVKKLEHLSAAAAPSSSVHEDGDGGVGGDSKSHEFDYSRFTIFATFVGLFLSGFSVLAKMLNVDATAFITGKVLKGCIIESVHSDSLLDRLSHFFKRQKSRGSTCSAAVTANVLGMWNENVMADYLDWIKSSSNKLPITSDNVQMAGALLVDGMAIIPGEHCLKVRRLEETEESELSLNATDFRYSFGIPASKIVSSSELRCCRRSLLRIGKSSTQKNLAETSLNSSPDWLRSQLPHASSTAVSVQFRSYPLNPLYDRTLHCAECL